MTTSSVAVIGSGPSGCYAAQAIVKAHRNCNVVVFEKLPMPYGLVRFGVAADHQGTKAVTRQFDRLFGHPAITYLGGVEVGRDIAFDEVLDAFDVVVWAGGMSKDRRLEIEGEDLRGVYGAGAVTRAWNGHPLQDWQPIEIGRHVLVVGAGNVAIDLVRLLAKDRPDLVGTDLDAVFEHTVPRSAVDITAVSRSGPGMARWDATLIRELASIDGVAFELAAHDLEKVEVAALRGHTASAAVLEHATAGPSSSRVVVKFVFGAVPLRVEGVAHVEGLCVAVGGGEVILPGDTVLTAVGFEHDHIPPLTHPRVFRAGWVDTNGKGAIPCFRASAKVLAADIAPHIRADSRRTGLAGVEAAAAGAVTFDQWSAIDVHERASAGPDRCRRKVRNLDDIEGILRNEAREGAV